MKSKQDNSMTSSGTGVGSSPLESVARELAKAQTAWDEMEKNRGLAREVVDQMFADPIFDPEGIMPDTAVRDGPALQAFKSIYQPLLHDALGGLMRKIEKSRELLEEGKRGGAASAGNIVKIATPGRAEVATRGRGRGRGGRGRMPVVSKWALEKQKSEADALLSSDSYLAGMFSS